jgi:hypothetical protein
MYHTNSHNQHAVILTSTQKHKITYNQQIKQQKQQINTNSVIQIHSHAYNSNENFETKHRMTNNSNE